jgi:hypothetical protein
MYRVNKEIDRVFQMMLFSLLKQRTALRPKKGFNLVGVNPFASYGEELYLIKNCDTLSLADDLALTIEDETFVLEADEE